MIAVFDIGKTNKKCFVFDEDYRTVFEKTAQLPETTDEDGDPCEDVHLLTQWVLDAWQEVLNDKRFDIAAVNCTTYGASLVCVGKDGKPVLPLYNYLKPFPGNLQKQFFDTCGSAEKISLETASPLLGSLNSGLQLYRIKYQKTIEFQRITYTLHLPQYIASLLHGRFFSDITSIGCHTMLWDFPKKGYHKWVRKENMLERLAPIMPSDTVVENLQSGFRIPKLKTGVGLHDSSAALIPYLACFDEPFVLISTGTWNISLNPFNNNALTSEELAQDCLCYLTYQAKPVKASRFFAGYEHDQAVKRIAAQFGVADDFYLTGQLSVNSGLSESYGAFMLQLVEKQCVATRLVLRNTPVRRIYVDGGFSKNEIFMRLLAQKFPELEVFAAEVAQATALGAALTIHRHWNKKPLPQHLISLKKY